MPSPRQATPFVKPKVLIGEGRDEENFFNALVAYLGLPDIHVEQYGGKDNLKNYLREFGVRPGHQNVVALAVTRDADDTVAQVFQSISTLLANNALPSPGSPGQFAVGPPRIGVFILPDNRRAGVLEDLCLDAVLADGAIACVDEFFQCVAKNTSRQPEPMAKARVHAWLASQNEPDLRLGEAALKDLWPWTDAAFQPIIQFLQAL
jgi:hypothetical protein